MPFPFLLPKTSTVSFTSSYHSVTHPSLPHAATTHRNVLRNVLKKHKRLPPQSKASNLTLVIAAFNDYLPYLLALEAGLSGLSVNKEDIDLSLRKEVEVEWCSTLSASIPGRGAPRLKGKGLDYEICFTLTSLAYTHVLLSQSQLYNLYAASPTTEQRIQTIQIATKNLLTANAIHSHLSAFTQEVEVSYTVLETLSQTQSALAALAMAEATLLAVLKDDPYPFVVAQSRNKSDKEWMIKPPEIPKVRAHLYARLCLAAADHAGKAEAELDASGGMNSDLIDYVKNLRMTSRAKACRFFGIDAELEGETGRGIAWLRAARKELQVANAKDDGAAMLKGFSRLKKDWSERREDKRIEKGENWGKDAGRLEELRVVEHLDAKWTKMNDTINTQLIPPLQPLVSSMPSGRDIHSPKPFNPPLLDDETLSRMRAAPDRNPVEACMDDEDSSADDSDARRSGVPGDFPGSTALSIKSYQSVLFNMSFLGGAECSTAGNPLSQFTKHVQDDKSLQRDRLLEQGAGVLREGFRSRPNGAGQDEQLMRDFLQQDGQILEEPVVGLFGMEQMQRDFDYYRISSAQTAGFDPAEQERMEAAFQVPRTGGLVSAGFTPAEFEKQKLILRDASSRVASAQSHLTWCMNAINDTDWLMMPRPYKRMNMERQASRQQASSHKGKGRMIELDEKGWEAQFAEMDRAGQKDTEGEANAAMDAELDQMDSSVLSEADATGFDDFASVWRGIQTGNDTNQTLNGENGQMGISMDGEDVSLEDIATWSGFDSHFRDAYRDPQLGNYTFEEDNPFATVRNPFEEGMKIMKEGGNLSLAALAFEAAVQQDPQHVSAWSQLGNTQAQNEKETPAIRAFEQCLKLDPTNLSALMGLAISYTNEGYDSTAYRTLERWLSTKYPQIVPPGQLTPEGDLGFTDRHLFHQRVTDYFIRAAQLSPSGTSMDPDVQVGLGVLFYGAEEYGKAVDCFEAALASTEEGTSNEPGQAPLLWNRLGATLANSGRSEEAIAAYERALSLNPNFVRARYNLGVSCINIGVYEQAAQHLLGALSMHKVVEREGMQRVQEVIGDEKASLEDMERMVAMNQSTNLLETLRRVFGTMGRRDLADRVEVGMDVDSFRGEFDF
ncbi:MAG: hypothetical protein Q9163_005908 [Psora crenata]